MVKLQIPRLDIIPNAMAHHFHRNLQELLEKFKHLGSRVGDEDLLAGVLTSSSDLFLYYRQTLVAMARLSTKKPLLDLCKLFGKWLLAYADLLTSKLPRFADFCWSCWWFSIREDEKHVNSNDEIKFVCLVINTSAYCQNTTAQVRIVLLSCLFIILIADWRGAPPNSSPSSLWFIYLCFSIKFSTPACFNSHSFVAWRENQGKNWFKIQGCCRSNAWERFISGFGDKCYSIVGAMCQVPLLYLVPNNGEITMVDDENGWRPVGIRVHHRVRITSASADYPKASDRSKAFPVVWR